MRKLTTAASLLLCLAGCDIFRSSQTESGDPRLKPFASAAEMKAYLAEQAENRWNTRGDIGFGLLGPIAGSPMPAAGEADQAAPAAEFSTTNLQEPGVDESDRVKTDGQYLYVATGDRLRIVRVDSPEQMAEVGGLQLEAPTDALYLRGDRIVALSGRGYFFDGSQPIALGASLVPPDLFLQETTVTIVSVADPSSPKVESTLSFEADLVTSRMIGDRLHLVLTTYPGLPPSPAEIMATPLDEMIPDSTVSVAGQVARAGNIAEWNDFYRPSDPDGYGMTTVVSLDIADPAGSAESTAVLADAGAIYASTEALYVTDTAYTYWAEVRETTDIYKFDLTGGTAAYAGSGSVPGRVLNQFSMGEHERYFRIATTDSGVFAPGGQQAPSSSAVYVLGPDGDGLQVVGKVEGIAPGESLYAARFIGTRGFLVTFKKIDPLFTLDLADPANPVIVGELKVPGYSEYLHMLDDNHLLAVGKDADDMGSFAWFQGVQLSLFDISAFDKPALKDKQVLGTRGTESEALWNHKAFNHYPSLEALAIPVELYEGGTGGSEYGEHTFSGVYVFHVNAEEGIDLLGRVATADAASYGMGWCRTVFIGQTLYAVTGSGIHAVPFGELDRDPWSYAFQ